MAESGGMASRPVQRTGHRPNQYVAVNAACRPTLHTNTMTTSTITWHKPTNYPDADVRVLIGLNMDGIRDSCEGYFGCNPDGRESYYTVDDQPIEHHHVTGWAEMPEGPAA